jgi:transposase
VIGVFPTAGHRASWAGPCPGNDQSDGKRRSGRTRKGSKWLNTPLSDATMSAIRTNDSYLQAQYQRRRPRLGLGRALGAVKHSILCACWHMLSTGVLYRELGGDYFPKRDPERQTKRLIAQLERLGLPSELGDTSSLACAGAIAPEGSRDRVGGPIQERPDPRNELKQGS